MEYGIISRLASVTPPEASNTGRSGTFVISRPPVQNPGVGTNLFKSLAHI
jgi:hypothetical protein